MGVSTWSGSFGGEYDYPLPQTSAITSVIAYAGGNLLLRTGFYSGADDSQYGLCSRLWTSAMWISGLNPQAAAWDLSGWIHNVTNSHYYLYRGASGGGAFPTYNMIMSHKLATRSAAA